MPALVFCRGSGALTLPNAVAAHPSDDPALPVPTSRLRNRKPFRGPRQAHWSAALDSGVCVFLLGGDLDDYLTRLRCERARDGPEAVPLRAVLRDQPYLLAGIGYQKRFLPTGEHAKRSVPNASHRPAILQLNKLLCEINGRWLHLARSRPLMESLQRDYVA